MIEAKDVVDKFVKKKADGSSLLSAIERDPTLRGELQKLGISEEEIKNYVPLLSAYQDSKDYCLKCPGLEACLAPSPRMAMGLTILDSGKLGETMGPCVLALKKEKLLGSYVYRDFPEEWLALSLRSFRNERASSVKEALVHAQKDETHPWAFLTGQRGTGKSYFLAAFANDFALRGNLVAFMNANKRFDELKGMAIANKPFFDKTMALLESCPLLVIDDFGSEYKSDYVRDQIVMPLLNERAKKHRMTFFASAFTLKEVADLYASNRSSALMAKQLADLIGSSIVGETLVPAGLDTFLK
jgi:hypothetical protein